MMKIRLLGLGLILAATTTVSAQKYSFETVNRTVYVFTDTNACEIHLKVKNNTATKLPLTWKVRANTLTENRWKDLAFCDPSLCYYAVEQGAEYVTEIDAHGTGDFKLSVKPKLYASLDSFSIFFHETGNTSQIDTLTYVLNAQTVGIKENQLQYAGRLNLYPNPAVNSINLDLKGSLTVAIFNMQGQNVYSQLNAGQRISIEALKPGLYMIQAVSGTKVYVAQFEKR